MRNVGSIEKDDPRVVFLLLNEDYFIVGIVNSGPALRPVGQRAVIVFMRV